MAGSKSGGKLAAQTNKRLYGQDYYKKLGKLPHKRGEAFKKDPELARRVGAIGGRISKRGRAK